jgi:hypothetical protein
MKTVQKSMMKRGEVKKEVKRERDKEGREGGLLLSLTVANVDGPGPQFCSHPFSKCKICCCPDVDSGLNRAFT